MTKEKTLLIFGIFVIVVPHLGFPNVIEKIILSFFGFLIIIIAYGIHFEKNKKLKNDFPVTKPLSKIITQELNNKEEKPPEKETLKEEDVVIVNKINFPKEEVTGFKYVSRPRKTEVKKVYQENEAP